VIDNKVQSNRIEDQVFWYKASERNNFRLSSPELWHIQLLEQERQAMGLVNKDDDGDDPYDPQQVVLSKKKGPSIRVQKRMS